MHTTSSPPQNVMYIIITVIAGLILPAVLIPIVALTGYSEVVEELAKALVVFFVIVRMQGRLSKFVAGAGFGLLFGFSESMFYLSNAFAYGDVSIIWQRLIWTVPMHIITVLLIVWIASINKKAIIVGFAVALLFHMVFNNYWIPTPLL